MSKAKYSKHFPVDGPWDSNADAKAFQDALQHFSDKKAEIKPLRLVKDKHPDSEGYWVEEATEPIDPSTCTILFSNYNPKQLSMKKKTQAITNDDMFAPIVTAVQDVSEAFKKLEDSKVQTRVILLLLRDSCSNMTIRDIEQVLYACKNLSKKYLKP